MNAQDFIQQLKRIQELAIIALFSDDELMQTFVLKGGNALHFGYKINDRASQDIDVAMESDFATDNLDSIKATLEKCFQKVFMDENYHVFDFKLEKRPFDLQENLKKFWGGYRIFFKVINDDQYQEFKNDLVKLRNHAILSNLNQGKTFEIDISKYEYCEKKELIDIDGYSVYVYTPLMIIYEKIRAICQQMEEYRDFVPTNRKQRARDFFDIYSIMNDINGIDVNDYGSPENLIMLKKIFELKRVPLNFLTKIETQREYHRENFLSVKDTITTKSPSKIGEYDLYFDFVVDIANKIYKGLEEQHLVEI